MSKSIFSHLNLFLVGCISLCIMGLSSCVQNTNKNTSTAFEYELLLETPGSITTKDTIIGREYIRTGETENFFFRITKIYYAFNNVDFKGEFERKRAGIAPAKNYATSLNSRMSDEELQIALQYISRKSNWENTDYEEISPVSPMGGSVKIPIVPKSAN